jgi:HD superfamily phosphohydrolase
MFFAAEPGYNVFHAIISSQLDCDRLDFLCRDRYHTGIRSANLDLEWLFDSLRIEKVSIDDTGDAKEYSFVFTPKGLAVAEEFVISYMKMYHNVYFHKTTRAVQHLVKDMLIALVSDNHDKDEIRSLPLVKFFRGNSDISTYLQLDDFSVVAIAHIAAANQWGEASNLATRFLCRDLYKCFVLPNTDVGSVPRVKLERFRARLLKEEIVCIEDIISHRNYKQYDVTNSSFLKNILIKNGDEIESLGSVSALVKLPAKRSARVYFHNVKDREKAAAIYETC